MLYQARQFIEMGREALWHLPEGPMTVMFDDGELETNNRRTIYSAYLWELHRLYPSTPLYKRHHIQNEGLRTDTHIVLMSEILSDMIDTYRQQGVTLNMEELSRLIYRITNDIYNHFTYRLENQVRSISILDYIDVIHHPRIRAANESVEPNQPSIDRCWREITQTLLDRSQLKGNAIAESVRNKKVSPAQALQCVGPIGQVTDVDSGFFRKPILVGFTHGIRNLTDSMQSSRMATKASAAAEDDLRHVEYFNRRLQLFAETIAYLHHTDCGSQQYLNWPIRSSKDLEMITGKYRLTETGLVPISKLDRHLIGTTVQLRSVIYCQLPDRRGVCSTCFGELSDSLPAHTNVGHFSATALCEQSTQAVLSTKHSDVTTLDDILEISEYDQQFIEQGVKGNTIKLTTAMNGKATALFINIKEAVHLQDILYVNDVRVLQPALISELTTILLQVDGAVKSELLPIAVNYGGRKASLTHEALDYIKRHGYTLLEDGSYQIDLGQWDVSLPMFVLPQKHVNMLEYMNEIASFVRGSVVKAKKARKQKKKRPGAEQAVTIANFRDPADALTAFYGLVSSRLFVNLAHLEVLIRCARCVDPWHGDYRVALPHEPGSFAAFDAIMSGRSLSAAMAYENHANVLYDPATYVQRNRPDHVLDPMLVPIL